MKLIVIQRMVIEVPELLEEDVKEALSPEGDKDYLEELIGDIEYRYGYEEVSSISVEELKEEK